MKDPAWSEAVEEAGWLTERLTPFNAYIVASVVARGFEAYVRVLHPAEEPGHGERLVRWRDVAAWSETSLRPDAQFHTVALPARRPVAPAPWSGQGPRQGSLYPPDAATLAGVLRGFTTAPERCWFCLWDGYGGQGRVALVAPGERPVTLPAVIPEDVSRGRRVHLPGRDYLLYTGAVEAVTATVPLADGQTANLWWPADRAWCVASEIDLVWTYVGGSADLIAGLLADKHLEVLPAEADDPLTRVEKRVTGVVEQATAELVSTGAAVIITSRGTVDARLERPGRRRPGALRTRSHGDNGVSGAGETVLHTRSEQDLRREITFTLTLDVLGLVGG